MGFVVLVPAAGMGRTDEALAQELLLKYLTLLHANGTYPTAICFYADGVKLLLAESPILAALRTLEESGVHLIACQTCLDHFGLRDEVKIGIVGGMGDILEAQLLADKVITL